MTTRRDFITLVGGSVVTSPLTVRAQQQKILRVGFVGIQQRTAPLYAGFVNRMAELGYQEGRNFAFEYLQGQGIETYERDFRELAARKVDIMMAAGNEPALRAARAAAGATPIVFLAIDFDPLGHGYVTSLARPGGNITGIFVRQLELAAKRIEVLRGAIPNARRVGLLFDAASRDQADAATIAARKLGYEPSLIEMTGQPPNYAVALQHMDDARGAPVVIPASPIFLRDRAMIGQLLLDRRTPAICAFRELVAAGALMSYGINLIDVFRDAAVFVDQIAKGAKPAELPIGQPSRFYTALNLKTAAALGITLPAALTALADEVIE